MYAVPYASLGRSPCPDTVLVSGVVLMSLILTSLSIYCACCPPHYRVLKASYSVMFCTSASLYGLILWTADSCCLILVSIDCPIPTQKPYAFGYSVTFRPIVLLAPCDFNVSQTDHR